MAQLLYQEQFGYLGICSNKKPTKIEDNHTDHTPYFSWKSLEKLTAINRQTMALNRLQWYRTITTTTTTTNGNIAHFEP